MWVPMGSLVVNSPHRVDCSPGRTRVGGRPRPQRASKRVARLPTSTSRLLRCDWGRIRTGPCGPVVEGSGRAGGHTRAAGCGRKGGGQPHSRSVERRRGRVPTAPFPRLAAPTGFSCGGAIGGPGRLGDLQPSGSMGKGCARRGRSPRVPGNEDRLRGRFPWGNSDAVGVRCTSDCEGCLGCAIPGARGRQRRRLLRHCDGSRRRCQGDVTLSYCLLAVRSCAAACVTMHEHTCGGVGRWALGAGGSVGNVRAMHRRCRHLPRTRSHFAPSPRRVAPSIPACSPHDEGFGLQPPPLPGLRGAGGSRRVPWPATARRAQRRCTWRCRLLPPWPRLVEPSVPEDRAWSHAAGAMPVVPLFGSAESIAFTPGARPCYCWGSAQCRRRRRPRSRRLRGRRAPDRRRM